ncbi:hypothetical protein [Bacillus spizizenii]|uniref:hypothetical protein n=1 Tax=Bacillus spizizenii TaxID=96241 RepID=UPI002FC990F0
MRERAHREKRPKPGDLFKRPASDKELRALEAEVEKTQHAAEWLSQFNFVREEDANGGS